MDDRALLQQALEALEWNYNTDLDNIPACNQWAKMLKETMEALRAALAEPQTTHWEGCEAVHPECKTLAEPEQKSDPGAWNGWVLREVLFDNGEPIGHREPEQEPVAWWNGRETVWFEHELMGMKPPIENAIPLYTTPTPRPLTDEEIAQISVECAAKHLHDDFDFARAIEKAHGIGDNNGS